MNPLTQFKKIRILPLLIAPTLVVLTALIVVPARATPPCCVTTDTIGIGRFDEIDASAKWDIDPGPKTTYWKAIINTKELSDLYVVQNTIAPGGNFGWHSHPGPSLVIVKSGTATFYFGDDPNCTPHVVMAGHGFVDQGGEGGDVHIVKNESTIDDLVTVVVSLVPAGVPRRIDQPDPGNCLPLPPCPSPCPAF